MNALVPDRILQPPANLAVVSHVDRKLNGQTDKGNTQQNTCTEETAVSQGLAEGDANSLSATPQQALSEGVAIAHYSAMVSYIIYEGNIFWVRAGFFLTLQLLLTNSLLQSISTTSTGAFIVATSFPLICIAGMVTWLFWCNATIGGVAAWNHYLKCLNDSEAALPGGKLYFQRQRSNFGIRASSIALMAAFAPIWIFVTTFYFYVIPRLDGTALLLGLSGVLVLIKLFSTRSTLKEAISGA